VWTKKLISATVSCQDCAWFMVVTGRSRRMKAGLKYIIQDGKQLDAVKYSSSN
jgi:hypothetical protein